MVPTPWKSAFLILTSKACLIENKNQKSQAYPISHGMISIWQNKSYKVWLTNQ